MGDGHVGFGFQFQNRTHQSVDRRGFLIHFLHITHNWQIYAFQLIDPLVALVNLHFQIAQSAIPGKTVDREFQLLLLLEQSVLCNEMIERKQHSPVLVEQAASEFLLHSRYENRWANSILHFELPLP